MPRFLLRCFLAIFAAIVVASAGCTTELDSEGVYFACQSDRDCVDGYECLEGAQGQRYCQDPDSYQDPDAGGDRDADVPDVPGFEDDVDDTGPDVGGECEAGEEEGCPCEELPGDVEGYRQCSDQLEWGQCNCPEACENFNGELVIEGAECGLCAAGVYECDDEGAAQCSEPGAINDCGGCVEHPPATACGAQELMCNTDESTSCVDIQTVELSVIGSPDLADADVFYALFEVDDVNAACGGGWEVAAFHRPIVYRRAQTGAEDLNYTIELPVDASPSSVVRLIIEQDLILYGDMQPTSVATHFGCATMSSTEGPLEIESYIHPDLLHGEYAVTFGAPHNFGGDHDSHRVWSHLANSWVFPAMYTFLSSPAYLFIGCEGDDCPHGTVEGLLDRYENIRSGSDVPTLSFWSGFYEDFQDFIEALDDLEALRLAYQGLFDSHVADVDAEISGFSNLRDGVFDGDRLEPLVYKEPMGRVTFNHPTRLRGEEAESAILVAASMTMEEPFYDGCVPIAGMEPFCFHSAKFVDVESPTTPLPSFEFDDRLQEVEIQSVEIDPPVEEVLSYFFYEHLPFQLNPRLEQIVVGPDQIEYQRADWESLSDMFRNIAPCDDVVQALEDQGVDASTAQAFGPVCDDLYGDPDGLNVLFRVRELVPLTLTEDSSASIWMTATQNCVPYFELDPYHGIRLRRVPGVPFGQCQAPLVEMSIGTAWPMLDQFSNWWVDLDVGLP